MKFFSVLVLFATILVELSISLPLELKGEGSDADLRLKREVSDPNTYSRMTEQVGSPADGLLARGGPGLMTQNSQINYCAPLPANSN